MVWRLPGACSALPAGVAILLLPILAVPQQLPVAPAHEAHGISSVLAEVGPVHQSLDTPLAHFRNTHIQSSPIPELASSRDASALATLALADSESAVRAPPAKNNSPNGPTPQLQARSLQDWEVEDFVLLATVDGTIHARDRKTGAARWSLSQDPSTPMVETIYHRANRSNFADVQPEDDFLWIIEPSRDGHLYIYNQGPNGGLQKLGLTVKSLVDETPYSGTDPPVTYTAKKETTLYTVDARTGTILRSFGSYGSTFPERSCRVVNSFEPARDEECESTGTLTLGRIEYTVTIQNTETGAPICTIKYSEWGSNNRDTDLQSQYFRSMDGRHIYSQHNGVIFGLDHSKPDKRRYRQKFSSPVARVFDVARPISADPQQTPLVILAQPLEPPDPNYPKFPDRVFIDCTAAGGWYAMSESTYPFVTRQARAAECYEKDYLAKGQCLMSLGLARQKVALVGVHSLNKPSRERQPIIPSISGPPADVSNDTPRDAVLDPGELSSPPAQQHGFPVRKHWAKAVDVLVTVIFLILASFLYFHSPSLQGLAKEKLGLKANIELDEKSLPSAPSTAIVAPAPAAESTETGLAETLGLPSESLEAAKEITVDLPVSDRQDGDATPRVRIQEPSQTKDEDEEEAPEKGKKKARRGRRGGQAHRRGRKIPGSEEAGANVEPAVDDVNQVQTQSRHESEYPLVRTTSAEMLEEDGALRIGQLKVYTDKVLGHGSHGTVVYKGSFDGRDVAVKRMLVEFYDIASHEVSLLQESDDHNNVIRYFCREQASGFLYIALELCPASLQEVVEKPADYPNLINGGLDVPDILRQITAGVRHLHSLKIVHRDLKPQNILVAAPKPRTGSNSLRLLISDFGLCKKLEDNQSSFRATTAHAAGTSGWRAPELLVDEDLNSPTPAPSDNQSVDSSEPAVVDPQTNRRATRAIDIFSLGCVFYYVLTRGGHPFDKDGKFMREANIVKGSHNLDDLQRLGDYAFEADDLIRQMLSLHPHHRPDASAVMMHPFFWSPAERLTFLCDVSDHFEFEPRDPPSSDLLLLESVASNVMGTEMDFLKGLPKDFKDSLGKQRKYTGSKMLDLLRALRNKRNHYNDMPEHLKAHIGGLPVGYLQFWTVRFPSLLINCHCVIVQLGLMQNERFRRYFTPPE